MSASDLLMGTAMVGGGALWAGLKVNELRDGKGDDGWAKPKQLRELHVKQAVPGRLTLGYAGRHLLATEDRHSVLVFGPTQSGKTTGFAIPAILEWEGPVVATSVKDDLVRHTLARRSEVGKCWVYDPAGSTSYPSAKWSPLSAATSWGGAERVAEWMCTAARARSSNLADNDFWHAVSGMLLAPLLYAAATGGKGMADVVRWVRRHTSDEPIVLLEEAGCAEALDAAAANYARDEKQLSGIYTTAETILRAFADPTVARSLTSWEVMPQKLLNGAANTLYVCGESNEQERLEALFATVVRHFLFHAMSKASREGALSPPLLVVLDEAANIAPVRDLAALASTAASHGVQLVSIFQDLAQISDRYGKRANTVLNNHRAMMTLGAVKDEELLKYVSSLLGDKAVSQTSSTKGGGRPTTTESTTYRKVAPPDVVRTMAPGQGLLVYGHLLPAHLRLRRYYENRGLRDLAGVTE